MTPQRVAIADDDPAIVELLVLLLSMNGSEVVGTAADGAAAVALVDDTRPDVLVLDLEMPEFDGRQVAELVRSRHPDTLIVLFTAADTEQIPPMDVDQVVSKADGPHALLAVLQELGPGRADATG